MTSARIERTTLWKHQVNGWNHTRYRCAKRSLHIDLLFGCHSYTATELIRHALALSPLPSDTPFQQPLQLP